MKYQKRIVFTLLLVLLAVMALSANTVLAGDAQGLLTEHPPVCYRVESFVPTGYFELRCDDAGKDIINVAIKTEGKYELTWDYANVNLRFYPANRHDFAYWTVQDKAGNLVSGRLP